MNNIRIPYTDREHWLRLRQNGIGGSEVSSILGLNKWFCNVELFYKKLGCLGEQKQSEPMYWGTIHEPAIANAWKYWDIDSKTMLENIQNKKIVRKCSRVNAYLQNPDFPFLFASVDRMINAGKGKQKGVLECKSIGFYASNQWEAEIPPYYLIQLQTYLLITGLSFGEIAVLLDGRELKVYRFDRNEDTCKMILDASASFWERVVTAREACERHNYVPNASLGMDQSWSPELGAEIVSLEPDPDNTIAYEQFLKERFQSKPATVLGTPENLQDCIKYLQVQDDIGTLEDEKQGIRNRLCKVIAEAEVLDCGTYRVSWRPDVKGNRRFVVTKLKEKL